MNATTISVLLVDDHDLFRTGLRRLLEEEAEFTVARATPAAATRPSQRARELQARRRRDGHQHAGHVRRRGDAAAPARPRPETAVLMLTVSDSEERVLDAILAGACGYMLKDASLFEIVGGIRAAAAGQSLIAPRVAGSLLERLREHGADPVAPRGPARAVRPRAPGPRAHGRRLRERRDRPAPAPQRQHDQAPRVEHPRQARRRQPHPGGRVRRAQRPRRGPRAPPRPAPAASGRVDARRAEAVELRAQPHEAAAQQHEPDLEVAVAARERPQLARGARPLGWRR